MLKHLTTIGPRAGQADSGRDVRLLLLSAAVNTVLFAAVLGTLTLGYESNDDAGMSRLVSGLQTGTPSETIVFSNVLIGKFLKLLYGWTDGVNWYTLYLVGVHFASMTGLLYAFLRVRATRLAVFLFAILFAQFEVGRLLSLQFTSTAVMAGVVGVFLALASATEESGRSRLAAVYAAALIVVSGMIRPDAMYYAVVLTSVLVAYEFLVHRDWRTLLVIGAGVLVALGAIAYDAWYYNRDDAWRAFREYNAVRSLAHDFPIVEYEPNTRFFFDRVGWSINDWRMFARWFFTDPDVFSYDHLKTIVDRFQGSTWRRTSPARYIVMALNDVYGLAATMYADMLLALLLCAGGRVRVALVAAAQWTLFEVLLFLFATYAKLPPRVLAPALFASSIVVFWVVIQVESQRRLLVSERVPAARWLVAAAAVPICAYFACAAYQTSFHLLIASAGNQNRQQSFRRIVRALTERYGTGAGDAVLINWATNFPHHATPPFDNYRYLNRLAMIDLGWNTRNPRFEETTRRFGLDDNLHQAIYRDPRVRVISWPEYIPYLKRYVAEHDDQSIRTERLDSFLVDTDLYDGALSVSIFKLGPGKDPGEHDSGDSP